MDFRIIPMERRYLKQAVDVHLRAFPGFFLSVLGRSFLYQYYLAALNEPSGISFIAQDADSDVIIGTVLGTASPAGFYRRLAAQRWWRFCLTSLGAVLRNPKITGRLIRALRYRGDPPDMAGYALLSSIAVTPEAQGWGVGKALMKYYLEEARTRACEGAYLTTDAFGNEAVNEFYRRGGWKIDYEFTTPEGRKMNRYTISFGSYTR